MKKQFLTVTLLFCITIGYTQITEKVTLNDSIIAYLKKTIQDKQLPGINFSIIDNRGKIKNYSEGFSDIEEQIPLTIEHSFFSGSIGKTYAATLVFKLVESGNIDLKKSYMDYFPDTEWLTNLPNIDDITVEMLLQHSSGLPRYVLKPEIWNQLHENPDKIWSYEERLSVIFEDEPVHEAGKGWAYSDTNYILLGMLIEKVTGQNYYDLVRTQILKPQHLTHTYPSLQRKITNLAVGYSRMPPAFHVPNKTVDGKLYFMNPQVEWTGGGMASTTEDLARWAKLYYEGALLNKSSLNYITTPNPNGTRVEGSSSYGMGSFIYETAHGEAYGHTGFMPGFNSIFIYYPKYGIAAAMQINCDYAVGVLNLNDFMDDLISISQISK
ncbi:serine hydrolase domain-containing protein [Hanstruepera ponticola]|uniref:serine hydrolase domain-containing protein n=1 Tax=Hanstruepera ponticola TaxID=2042995 RepID=UPI001780CCCF|nr:serine hydrolase domain-containing protein [Hanstruepera ponticola]